MARTTGRLRKSPPRPEPVANAGTDDAANSQLTFPADAWAAFAVQRLAEDLRCGGLSRWSEPAPLEALSAELSGLRQGVGRALAQKAPGSKRRSRGGEAAKGAAGVGLCANLRALAAAAADNAADSGCHHLTPALLSLAASTVPGQRLNDCSLPGWCAASSSGGPPPGIAESPSAGTWAGGGATAWAGLEDVGTAVLAYCSALEDVLNVESPACLGKVHRHFDTMLPPHIRDTTMEINAQVCHLREALLASCAGPARDASPLRASSPRPSPLRATSPRPSPLRATSPSGRQRNASPTPQGHVLRQRTPLRRWGAGWGTAAAVAAGNCIRELLARLVVQADASDAGSTRPTPFSVPAESASAAVGLLLERHLGISCGVPASPLQAWFSAAARIQGVDGGEFPHHMEAVPESFEAGFHDDLVPKRARAGDQSLPIFMVDLMAKSIDVVKDVEVTISCAVEHTVAQDAALSRMDSVVAEELGANAVDARNSDDNERRAEDVQKSGVGQRDRRSSSCCWAFF